MRSGGNAPVTRRTFRATIECTVDFRLLGPLEVESDGRDLTPARHKQRLLLAALLVRSNEVVSADELIEVVWSSSPPATAAKALHGHISALRKAIGAGAIETRPPGYVLHVEYGGIDTQRFEGLIEAAGNERDPARRRELLSAALSLFRGEPLADFRDEPIARDEANRLEGLRVNALADRLEAELELGRHVGAIPELEQMVAENPYEERLRALLMLALYRAGRQTQALDVYTDGRSRFVAELGIEPGPELHKLERQILNQDPALELPARAGPRRQTLPRPLTDLIGRAHELEAIAALLEDHLLVTLAGPAGAGKTRLALAAAAESNRFPGGSLLASLAPVSDPQLVLPTIAEALGIREGAGGSLFDAVVDALLGAEPTIVVLDNCEHLLDGLPVVAELIAAARSLTILATSREPLHLAGERVFVVPPLSGDDAVRLFVERASAVKPDFQLSQANEVAVRELCRRLDDLPLTIELAAARIPLFTVQGLLERLDQRFSLLTAGPRDLPRRQQTLRAAIDWSHDLLPDEQRTLLARLSLFGGGWTLEAAETVCDDLDVVDGIASLVDKSLVQLAHSDQDPRFTMLETIRGYAQEQLAARPDAEQEDVRDNHLLWATGLAERAAPQLRGDDQRVWLERLHVELDNFRAAFDWSIAREDAELALRLVAALLEFWLVRADWREGLRWVERALALPEGSDLPVRTTALRAGAELADALSDYDSARVYYEHSLALARRLEDRRGVAEALFGLAFEAERVGDYKEARRLTQESVDIMRELGDEPSLARSLGGLAWLENDFRRARVLWTETLDIRRRLANSENVAWTLIQIGFCAQCEGDYPAARSAYEESLTIAEELGYERMIARSVTQLGEVAVLANDPERAKALLVDTVATWRRIGHRSGLVDALRVLGEAACLADDLAGAGELLAESKALAAEIGARPLEAKALQSLARLLRAQGELDQAELLFKEALEHWQTIEDVAGTAEATRGLGEVAALRGDAERASQLLADSESLRDQVGAAVPPSERELYERALSLAAMPHRRTRAAGSQSPA
jgi:predicted ATPase/DNA-binding SARP family transcriptional activator